MSLQVLTLFDSGILITVLVLKPFIRFFQIVPQEKRLYQLKDKNLERQSKGHIVLTFDLIFNPIRASFRTFNPREVNALFDPPRFRRQVRSLPMQNVPIWFAKGDYDKVVIRRRYLQNTIEMIIFF